MTTTDSEEGVVMARQVTKVKSLLQGPPLTVKKIEGQLDSDDLALFGVDTPADLFDLIRITAGSLLDDDGAVAIRNGLGLGWTTDSNLTERRMALLENVDITIRALQKREDAGAELLVRQMAVMRKMRPDLGRGLEGANIAAELEALGSRVDRSGDEPLKLWIYLWAQSAMLNKVLGVDDAGGLVGLGYGLLNGLDKLVKHKELDGSLWDEEGAADERKVAAALQTVLGEDLDAGDQSRQLSEAINGLFERAGGTEEDAARIVEFIAGAAEQFGGKIDLFGRLYDLKKTVEQQHSTISDLAKRVEALEKRKVG